MLTLTEATRRAAYEARPEVRARQAAYQAAYRAELFRLARLAREAGLG